MKQNKKLTLPSLVVAINPIITTLQPVACLQIPSFLLKALFQINLLDLAKFLNVSCVKYMYSILKIFLYLFHRKSLAVRTTNNPAPKNRKMIILSPKYKSCEHGSFKNMHVSWPKRSWKI